MAGVAEPGTGLLTRCILMRRGCWGSFALHRKGILRVLRTRGIKYSCQRCCKGSILCFVYLGKKQISVLLTCKTNFILTMS